MAQLTPTLPGYRELELIAHGTTSLVFRAVQERLNRTVAVKLLLVDQAVTTPEAVARELATMVRLSAQPHIVSIIDTGVTEAGQPYTVMDFCEDGSYAQLLTDRGPLPVDEVVEVGQKIGEALHAAHRVGIIHRDVKPSNILSSQFGPALADFGIARAPEELAGTLTREMMTPHHASPEALLHQAQSGLSDVYSLASTMWALLVGYPPFVNPERPATDLNSFRDRVLHDPLPPMPRADVPEWLGDELRRAMSKRPVDRHASAQDFVVALRRGALGLPPAGLPPVTTRVHTPGPPIAAAYLGRPERGEPATLEPRDFGPPDPFPPMPRIPLPPPVAQGEFAARPASAPPAVGEPTAVRPAPGGGWLGTEPLGTEPLGAEPAVSERPTSPAVVAPAVEAWSSLPPPRFDPVPARRGGLIALVAGVGVVGLVAAGILAAQAGGEASAAPTPSPSVTEAEPVPTRTFAPRTDEAPTSVHLDEAGEGLTLRWHDPSQGRGAPVIFISRDGATFQGLPQQPKRGATSAFVPRPTAGHKFCYRVGLVMSTEDVRVSSPVCTS